MRRVSLRSSGPVIYSFRSDGLSEGPAKPLIMSINELADILGESALVKFDSRKTWAILVPTNKTREDAESALREGKYSISETAGMITVIPKFD